MGFRNRRLLRLLPEGEGRGSDGGLPAGFFRRLRRWDRLRRPDGPGAVPEHHPPPQLAAGEPGAGGLDGGRRGGGLGRSGPLLPEGLGVHGLVEVPPGIDHG